MTPNHTAILKSLVVSDHWKALVALQEDLGAKWRGATPTGGTDFLYLKECIERDARADGVRLFLQAMLDLLDKKQ